MESLSPARIAVALLLALPLVACGPSDEADRAVAGPIKGPFLVSNFFTPSGLMGDGATPGRVWVDINDHCKPRPAGAQGDCYRFTYIPGDVHWAGAYWVYPANNWGTTRGRPVIGPVDKGVPNPDNPAAGNLRGYTHARAKFSMCKPEAGLDYCPCGEDDKLKCPVLPAENQMHFWVGRLDGRTATPPQPYYDEGCAVYPDTVLCSTDQMLKMPRPDGTTSVKVPYFFQPGETTVPFPPLPAGPHAETDWLPASIDLSNWAPQRLIAGFGFSSNDEANKVNGVGMPQVIYIDDIVWE
jgi:hypothetical protein